MALNPDLVAEVRDLDRQATPKPWHDRHAETGNGYRTSAVSLDAAPEDELSAAALVLVGRLVALGLSGNDARLIARYRTLAPLLADEVERVRADNQRLRAELTEARLTLAAEQGRPEGAPSSRWTWRGDHWQVGPDTDLEARVWPGGRLYLRDPKRICGTLTHHGNARAAMLAADAALRESEK